MEFVAKSSKTRTIGNLLIQTLFVTCTSSIYVLLSLSHCNERVLCSVIGLSDGLTVPFALTAGLSSLGESKLVVVGGVAELIAGAISMGIGGFRKFPSSGFLLTGDLRRNMLINSFFLLAVASQSERDHYRFLRKQTAARVIRSCDGEMEREVHTILGPVGVDERLSRQVADCLRKVELDSHGLGANSSGASSEEDGGLRWSNDVGLTAFLLKFGEGLGKGFFLISLSPSDY